jgi:hypothetical protein
MVGSGDIASAASASTHLSSKAAIGAKAAPGDTPQKALEHVLTGLKDHKSAEVTAENVPVTGATGNAEAKPLVFHEGGQTYFAYTQGYPPNFRLSAAELAGKMLIIDVQFPTANEELPLTTARLYGGVLEDSHTHTPVGYAIGGDPQKLIS